jgi:NTE family protein
LAALVPGMNAGLGLLDTAPMRRALSELVDFGLLNHGPTRTFVQTLDLETGEPIGFDTARDELSVDHLLASAALIPDFPPVRIGGRWLVDGGLVANVPLDLVLADPPAEDCVCYLVDPFPLSSPLPKEQAGLSIRHGDLIFACQTEMAVRHFQEVQRLRAASGIEPEARIELRRIAYHGMGQETSLKSWDCSPRAITQRWQAGLADMERACGG